MYQLSSQTEARLKEAIEAAWRFPFIDDVEDYILEAIWCYAKEIPVVDPLTTIRSKRLFDVVDPRTGTGWSVKGIQWPISEGCEFELVIQRADIFKKARDLGFETLNIASNCSDLGEALLRHWSQKIETDATMQNVTDRRIFILLKSKDRKHYAAIEDSLHIYSPAELEWRWTDDSRTGLQGIRRTDGTCVYRWYPNQKQFFERFQLSPTASQFDITPCRLETSEAVRLLAERLKAPIRPQGN